MRIIAIVLFILLAVFIVVFSCVILETAERELKRQRGVKNCEDKCKEQKDLGFCSGQCDICIFNTDNVYPEDNKHE